MLGQRIGDIRDDLVDAFTGVLDDHIAGFVDFICVVAKPPGQGIRAVPTIEDIVGIVARDGIVQAVALDIGFGLTMYVGQRELLGLRLQPVCLPDWIVLILFHRRRAPTSRGELSFIPLGKDVISYQGSFHSIRRMRDMLKTF
jgi:hypothetical protein